MRPSTYIADHPEDHFEYNPIMGRHPSRSDVNLYMAASLALHPVVSYVLPRPYREVWQYGTIVIKIGLVAHNYSVGIGLAF